MWAAETVNDPFLSLAIAAEHSERIGIGTAIAVAFARNPMSVAYTANQLHAFSQGRMILGLGTQVRSHIEKRSAPSGRARPRACGSSCSPSVRSGSRGTTGLA